MIKHRIWSQARVVCHLNFWVKRKIRLSLSSSWANKERTKISRKRTISYSRKSIKSTGRVRKFHNLKRPCKLRRSNGSQVRGPAYFWTIDIVMQTPKNSQSRITLSLLINPFRIRRSQPMGLSLIKTRIGSPMTRSPKARSTITCHPSTRNPFLGAILTCCLQKGSIIIPGDHLWGKSSNL